MKIDKCAVIFLFYKKNMLFFDNTFNNLNLSRKDSIKNLGVFFDSKLSFNHHVDYIRNKSL